MFFSVEGVDGGDSQTAADVPKFHYEVHHVTHEFGLRTPADVKLRDVARHAARHVSVGDDDDEDEGDDETPPPPAAARAAVGARDTSRLSHDDTQYYYDEDYEWKRREDSVAAVSGIEPPLARVANQHSPSSVADVYFVGR